MKWSGKDESGRSSENITYLSSDGQVFESNKAVCDFVRETSGYTALEAANCAEFQKRRSEKRKREGEVEKEKKKRQLEEEEEENEKRRKVEVESKTMKRKADRGNKIDDAEPVGNPKRKKMQI